jgi:membrane-bound metal-dependent hydrolase YbcI (DUF457 family)
MKRVTHGLLGAAVAMPLALAVSPGTAIGCVWWGMAGGGFPDWLDLRSDLRKPLRLRHRGVSHSAFAGVLLTLGVFWLLRIAQGAELSPGGQTLSLGDDAVWFWTASFAAGFASHVLSDACTRGGIQPWLPFSEWKLWLLPKPLRSRSDGYLDRVARLLATVTVIAGVAIFTMRLAGSWG